VDLHGAKRLKETTSNALVTLAARATLRYNAQTINQSINQSINQ